MKILSLVTLLYLLTACIGKSQTKPHKMEVFTFHTNAIEKLTALRNQTKFGEEELYTGLLPKEDQPIANGILNKSIDHLITILQNNPSKEKILDEYRRALSDFDEMELDTEDMERVCEYYDQIREIIGFDSTDDVLNDWLY